MKQVAELTTPFDIGPGGNIILPADNAVSAPAHPADGWISGRLSQEDRAMIAVSPDVIDLAVRAGHLARALDEISAVNSHEGYAQAVQSPEHRPDIEARYGDDTDGIAEGAAYNVLVGERRAQYEFFAANGLGNLALATKHTKLTADERVVRRSLNDSWLSFRRTYGATGRRATAKRRNFKAALDQQVAFAQTPASA